MRQSAQQSYKFLELLIFSCAILICHSHVPFSCANVTFFSCRICTLSFLCVLAYFCCMYFVKNQSMMSIFCPSNHDGKKYIDITKLPYKDSSRVSFFCLFSLILKSHNRQELSRSLFFNLGTYRRCDGLKKTILTSSFRS